VASPIIGTKAIAIILLTFGKEKLKCEHIHMPKIGLKPIWSCISVAVIGMLFNETTLLLIS